MSKLFCKYCWSLGLIFLFFLPTVLADITNLTINEVMYNPKGSDTDAEWIEIYNPNNELINFLDDALFIADDRYEQQIQDYSGWITETNATYFIITSCYSSFYDTLNNTDIIFNPMDWLHLDDEGNPRCDRIGNNLKNTEDYIELWYCGNKEEECDLLDFLWYNSSAVYYNNTYYSIEGNTNGKSLQLINNSWIAADPTPGQANELVEEQTPQKEIKLITNIDVFLFNHLNYTKLFKIQIKNKDNCSEKENISINYSVYDNINDEYIKEDNFTVEVGCTKTSGTGHIYFEDPGNYTLCGYLINNTNISDCLDVEVVNTSTIKCNLSLEINNTKEIYEYPEKIIFRPILSNKTFPYKIEYWFEDLFGNIVRKKITTLNTYRKSWKPSLDEPDKVFLIKLNLSFIACNDTNLTDNSAEQLIIVKDPTYSKISPENNSYVKILEVDLGSDNKAKFGEAIKVKINIYRGNTQKYSTSLWVEGTSKISTETLKIHTLTKFTNYTFTIPVQLKPNCDKDYADGIYYVKLEGLNSSDSATINVEGITSSLCEESSSSSSSSKSKFSFEILSMPNKIEIGKEFTTKVKITSDDEEHIIDIWSYVYKGNKCYSGEREENLQSITLPADSSVIVELKNTVKDAEPGSYKFKVKLRKDNQKTPKELTKTITLTAPEIITTVSETNINQKDSCSDSITIFNCSEGILVYESSSEKTKKLTYWLILLALFLLNAFLIWKK